MVIDPTRLQATWMPMKVKGLIWSMNGGFPGPDMELMLVSPTSGSIKPSKLSHASVHKP